MAKMKFDKQYCVEIPTLLLQNRNFDTYGNIVNFTDLAYTENFNSPNELSFNIVNEDNLNKDNSLAKWDDIVDFRILYAPPSPGYSTDVCMEKSVPPVST